MDWRFLIITLIPLAVWIIWNIIRTIDDQNEDKDTSEPDAQRRPDTHLSFPAMRRPPNDFDQFAREARSRRASRAHQEESQRSRRRADQEPFPKRQRAEELPRARPVLQDELPRARPVEQPPRTQPPAPVVAQTAPSPQPQPEPQPLPVTPVLQTPDRPGSAIGTRLRTLLGDRESLMAAVALHEILGRPVCMRPRSTKFMRDET